MENSGSKKTPMSTAKMLNKNEHGKRVNQKLYRGIIRSLLYVTTSKPSKPNIMFNICLCTRYQSNPKESYLKAVKKILRYIKQKHAYLI